MFFREMICGIDEVGRGPLAGPVAAAAAVFVEEPPAEVLGMLRDSKKLSHVQRVRIREAVRPYARWCVGWAWPAEIDAINIRQATFLAMKRAQVGLERKLLREGLVLRRGADVQIAAGACGGGASHTAEARFEPLWDIRIDGIDVPEYFLPDYAGRSPRRYRIMSAEAIIKGDTKVAEIQVAAIAAKEARDDFMVLMDARYPGYGLAGHKGYPTKVHREAVLEHGLSAIHRVSFCKKLMKS